MCKACKNRLVFNILMGVYSHYHLDTAEQNGSEDGLSAGAVAAIVIVLFLLALAVAVIGIVLVLLYCYKLRMAVVKKVKDYGMCAITI